MCYYNSELSKLPDRFHNALFTNLLAAPLSILRSSPTCKQNTSKLCKSKATGLDNISGKLLRECPDLISESLLCLFNLSIKKKIFAMSGKAHELLYSTRMKEIVQI